MSRSPHALPAPEYRLAPRVGSIPTPRVVMPAGFPWRQGMLCGDGIASVKFSLPEQLPIALYGAYADEPQTPGAPRPAYGHSKDGRDDLKQVLLSLGVSGAGGVPLRLGLRDGNRSDSVETPLAIEECLALGLEGVRGIVADSKAYSRRTLGLCLERGLGLEAVWKESLYKRRPYGIYVARLRTDLLDNRPLAMLLET